MTSAAPRLPPRWFIRSAWVLHAGACDGLDRHATLRSRETAVVVFEPRATVAATGADR